MGTGAPE